MMKFPVDLSRASIALTTFSAAYHLQTQRRSLVKNGIILASSDSEQIAKIKSIVNNEFQILIEIVENFGKLLARVREYRPQLIILGKFDKFNYFEIGERLRKIHANLEIVLISRDLIILDSYRDALRDAGITVIADSDSEKLNRILDKLERPIVFDLEQPSLTGAMMVAILQEIISIGSQHFDLSILDKYCRKTHQDVLAIYPTLQHWSVDAFCRVSCHEYLLEQELNDRDIQSLTLWLRRIVEESEQINADFREILNTSDTSLLAKYFLKGI
jgi:hypothetical protein